MSAGAAAAPAGKLGCSAEQAEVLLGFLEAAIHTVLYARGVYPPELFELRKQYNVPVRMARHPVLRDYIASLLTADQLGHWLQRGLVDQLVLAILAPDGQPLERFVFELAPLLPAAPRHCSGAGASGNLAGAAQSGVPGADVGSEALATAAESALRACLIRLSGCARLLLPNRPEEPQAGPDARGLTFSVVIHMRGEGAALGPPSPAHPHATDAWVEAVGQERCEVRWSPC
jgi:mitotic spindle assembly checkpoint protein MAD2B